MYPWENTVRVKPWEYRCTVTLACLDTPDDVAAVVRLWRAQTVRPYIMVIDTGSTPENLNKLLALRADDVEVHCLQPNAWLHPCDAPAIACSLAADLCRTKHLIFTHSDVYPCRRDLVEELLALCVAKSPVVGYSISKPRPYEVKDTWVGHQLTCVARLRGASTPSVINRSPTLSTSASASNLRHHRDSLRMGFIHAREFLSDGRSVRVDCDTQCNVMPTDDSNFSSYRGHRPFRYTGDHYTRFPVILAPPHSGYWNVTIDLGGGNANIRYSITVVG